jgi:phenylacetyl-CoA:acceptor oxidoreductase
MQQKLQRRRVKKKNRMDKNLLNKSAREKNENVWIPTLCYSCNKGICLIRVHRVNGVVVNLEGNIEGEGFKELAQNKGFVCLKSYGNIQKLYNPHRIKAPMMRTNPQKGRGIDPRWIQISWEEALSAIAEKLKNIREDDSRKFFEIGPGRKPSINGTWEPFLKALGPVGNFRSGGGVHCRLSDHIFAQAIHGAFVCEPDYSYCDYILMLGVNRLASGGVTLANQLVESRARRTKVVVVDPVLTVTAAKADEWIPIKPCTDTAFLLSLIHVIIYEIGVYDEEFLKNMTNSPYLVGPDGYFIRDKKAHKPLVWDAVDQKAKVYDDETIRDFALEGTYSCGEIETRPAFEILKDHVNKYSPDWASEITEIPPHTIRRIAQELVDHAKIGSTIQIEDLTLPFRPVSTNMGRGISGSMHSYHAFLSEHILNVLLGCLEVVGGHKGGSNQRGGFYATAAYKDSHSFIKPDHDGMVKIDAYEFTWPPISSDAKETLFPYGILTEVLPAHLSYVNYSEPPKNLPLAPGPEMAIAFRVNPLVALGDPELVGKVLKKIPFFVAIAYVENEVTELANIVLPDHTDLERYELAPQTRGNSGKFSGVALRQPVIKPLHNTMDISDILTELAERAGFLAEYNNAINEGLGMGLAEPYQLKLDKKYSWIEIVGKQCKSYSWGKYDLQWFKKNAAMLTSISADKIYDVYLEMKGKKIRYPLPYLEHVKKTGDKLKRNLSNVNIDWWSTEEYLPLPTYFPPILDQLPEEYDFYVTRCETMQFYRGTNVEIPWLIESAEHVTGQGAILMNAAAAESRGIKDGDEIWVESPVGRIKQKIKLVQGIRPDTLQIPGQFGHWATPIIKETGWVGLSALLPIRYSWTDPLTGAMQSQVMKAKIFKA